MSKRIPIVIAGDLLELLDRMVEVRGHDNRSSYIRHLIRQDATTFDQMLDQLASEQSPPKPRAPETIDEIAKKTARGGPE